MIANTVPGRLHFVALYIAMAAALLAVTNAPVHAQVQESADMLPENSTSKHNIQTVFVIPMENRNWSDIKGSSEAPYINKTLLPMAAYANNFLNPLHPSLPNYITFEAGSPILALRWMGCPASSPRERMSISPSNCTMRASRGAHTSKASPARIAH
jgi:hypothetical protein